MSKNHFFFIFLNNVFKYTVFFGGGGVPLIENDQPKYQNLFSDEIEKQSKIAMSFQERYKKRKELIQKMECVLEYIEFIFDVLFGLK